MNFTRFYIWDKVVHGLPADLKEAAQLVKKFDQLEQSLDPVSPNEKLEIFSLKLGEYIDENREKFDENFSPIELSDSCDGALVLFLIDDTPLHDIYYVMVSLAKKNNLVVYNVDDDILFYPDSTIFPEDFISSWNVMVIKSINSRKYCYRDGDLKKTFKDFKCIVKSAFLMLNDKSDLLVYSKRKESDFIIKMENHVSSFDICMELDKGIGLKEDLYGRAEKTPFFSVAIRLDVSHKLSVSSKKINHTVLNMVSYFKEQLVFLFLKDNPELFLDGKLIFFVDKPELVSKVFIFLASQILKLFSCVHDPEWLYQAISMYSINLPKNYIVSKLNNVRRERHIAKHRQYPHLEMRLRLAKIFSDPLWVDIEKSLRDKKTMEFLLKQYKKFWLKNSPEKYREFDCFIQCVDGFITTAEKIKMNEDDYLFPDLELAKNDYNSYLNSVISYPEKDWYLSGESYQTIYKNMIPICHKVFLMAPNHAYLSNCYINEKRMFGFKLMLFDTLTELQVTLGEIEKVTLFNINLAMYTTQGDHLYRIGLVNSGEEIWLKYTLAKNTYDISYHSDLYQISVMFYKLKVNC